MLQSCTTQSPLFPPTILYNEGWLLRLVLDWFSAHRVSDHPLSFYDGSRWFSEALLPSAFLARPEGDPLAEGWTHADGVVGHLAIGKKGKADTSLLQEATHFAVLEAKMLSGLSSGVKNASFYDQAARTVACIAEVISRAKRCPLAIPHLGFYVLAPQSQIERGVFAQAMDRDSIGQKVEKRVKQYTGAKDEWHLEWFLPTFEQIEIGVVSWEELIATVREHDSADANSLKKFYDECCHCARLTTPPSRHARGVHHQEETPG